MRLPKLKKVKMDVTVCDLIDDIDFEIFDLNDLFELISKEFDLKPKSKTSDEMIKSILRYYHQKLMMEV